MTRRRFALLLKTGESEEFVLPLLRGTSSLSLIFLVGLGLGDKFEDPFLAQEVTDGDLLKKDLKEKHNYS